MMQLIQGEKLIESNAFINRCILRLGGGVQPPFGKPRGRRRSFKAFGKLACCGDLVLRLIGPEPFLKWVWGLMKHRVGIIDYSRVEQLCRCALDLVCSNI